MAKRRRLSPAAITGQTAEDRARATDASGPLYAPPIAQVAGEAAGASAAQEMADELTRARTEGRMAQDIRFDQIDETHLSRDRIAVDAEDLAALEASISARGQQMPIEVVDLGAEASPRYGLISGFRRLLALRHIAQRDGAEKGATIRAILRRPESAAEAYLAMVEENELRVGLSFYERAQVAARACDLGVFDTSLTAVQSLFSTASKAKQSKINAFVRVFRGLDPVLTFPDRLTERLGLRLAKALEEPGRCKMLYEGLQGGKPFANPTAEQAWIERLLAQKKIAQTRKADDSRTFPGAVVLTYGRGSMKVSGKGVDEGLKRDLAAWLAQRQADKG